eukprot:1195493-Prorocentrum_minimum.AAC.6
MPPPPPPSGGPRSTVPGIPVISPEIPVISPGIPVISRQRPRLAPPVEQARPPPLDPTGPAIKQRAAPFLDPPERLTLPRFTAPTCYIFPVTSAGTAPNTPPRVGAFGSLALRPLAVAATPPRAVRTAMDAAVAVVAVGSKIEVTSAVGSKIRAHL